MALLALLSPIGLILPNHFKAGDAWGEWSIDTVKKETGYMPAGLEKLSSVWNAPVPDYTFKGWEEKGLKKSSLAYIFSALAGIALCATFSFLIGKLIARKNSGSSGN